MRGGNGWRCGGDERRGLMVYCGARVCGESAENGEGGGNGDEDKERNGCKRLIWEEGMVECVRVKRTKI